MENFIKLPIEKKNIIINAALKSFGTNGYKKSFISDIATGAGISKAMIFHYFGTKKALYLYLMDLCCNILMNEFDKKFDDKVTDFFDRILFVTNIKISVMKKSPEILSFLGSMNFEKDEEVKEEIKAYLTKGEDFKSKMAAINIDTSKFKEGIDSKLVMKMFDWLSEGYVSQLLSKEDINSKELDKNFNEFRKCIDLFKNNFYNQKYLE